MPGLVVRGDARRREERRCDLLQSKVKYIEKVMQIKVTIEGASPLLMNRFLESN